MNIVVAACKNRGIGINNKLPWCLSNDLKYFKFLTKNKGKDAIVMGKNTCLSLPRALPKRVNYVLSKSLQNPTTEREKFLMSGGYGDFRIIEDVTHVSKEKYDNIWLIGGDKVYSSLIDSDMINSIYYTDIDADFKCDTYFPEIPNKFKGVFQSENFYENDINYNMKVYVKEGLNTDIYINNARTALHLVNNTLG